ncbi:MAG TPA: CPBP family intramembrane glutamic endopeptidase, partial [Hymenobacter sp.]
KWKIIFVMIIVLQSIGFVASLFFILKNPIEDKNISIIEKFFLLSFVGPVIETLLFQTIIIKIALKLFENKAVSVLISSLVFGLAHNYSGAYIFVTLIMGFFFGLFYVICENHYATIHVIILHSLYNAAGILIYDIVLQLA